MAHWLETISWHDFDAAKAAPAEISAAKAACMVEHNGYDYARYLSEVFADDEEFKAAIRQWAEEEVLHGKALRAWAERADPAFDFDKSFAMFTEGYKLPLNVSASVRGSRSGELVARCVVEIGTSSYYTAIGHATGEPVLKEICRHIAADEFRHYKLFYSYLKQYLEKEKIGRLKRLWVALGRITESEDDELAYAYHASHYDGAPYDHARSMRRYQACALSFYRREYVDRMTAMVLKAAGVKPYRLVQKGASRLAWRALQAKAARAQAHRAAA